MQRRAVDALNASNARDVVEQAVCIELNALKISCAQLDDF
jgi:hypothetical protein